MVEGLTVLLLEKEGLRDSLRLPVMEAVKQPVEDMDCVTLALPLAHREKPLEAEL